MIVFIYFVILFYIKMDENERWMRELLIIIFKRAKQEMDIPRIVKTVKILYQGYDIFDNIRDVFYDIQASNNFENIADYLVNSLIIDGNTDAVLTELTYAAIMERNLSNLKYLHKKYGISWNTMKRILQQGDDYYEIFPTLYQQNQKMDVIQYVHKDMGLTKSGDYFEGLVEVYQDYRFLNYYYKNDLLNPIITRKHLRQIQDNIEYAKDMENKRMELFFKRLL